MLGKRHPRRYVDAHLDGLASGDAEIVPLEISALMPCCYDSATCGAKALATISTATAMIRVVFMWTSVRWWCWWS